MENANLTIVIPVVAGMMMLLLATIIWLNHSLSRQKKLVVARLRRLKGRFSNQRVMPSDRSIRINQQSDDLLSRLSNLLPRRDMLAMRLERAGMTTRLPQYAAWCSGFTLLMMFLMLLIGLPPVLAVLLGVFIGVGLPHMLVGMRIKGRIQAFNKQFPEAIDLMVRGLKSGLPVNETIANVSEEVGDPIGAEFRRIVDQMRLGKTLEDALWSAARRLDSQDFKFFITSLTVQRETGGNLGETLGNLSKILRARQAMKLKIKALSSEAKASAMIVGFLPFIMLGLIMMLNYDYGIVLFTHPQAIVASISGLVWMLIGIAVMAKMINFEA